MKWLSDNWFKLFIALILLVAVVFINRHLKISSELAQHKFEETKKQERREYIAKRRAACYEIYAKERRQWNNVEGPEYDSEDDICRIRYKNTRPKERDCSSLENYDKKLYIDCITNTSTSDF